MQIYHLKHKDIDKSRWDTTITRSINGNIYGYSWYLDAVSPDWEALINLDYSIVLPLTKARKYGFSYLCRPVLSQQLGVFSTEMIKDSEALEYFKALPKQFKLIEICLNKYNPLLVPGFSCSQHTSYELDLIGEYSSIRSQYSQNNRRNINKTRDQLLIFKPVPDLEAFSNLLANDSSDGAAILLKGNNQIRFNNLLIEMLKRKTGIIWGAYNTDNTLIAAILFGVSHQKFYYLVPVNTQSGRDSRALFGLIDAFIQQYCGNSLILDFEGSDIPGLARFYAGFGAQKTSYSFIRKNTLPWPVSVLKKS
ncbi:MAG: hypothetical protein HOG34_03825 [Bacteroidetes bacterium]|nr:hypothetical protein [Bacteroidota bacterium]